MKLFHSPKTLGFILILLTAAFSANAATFTVDKEGDDGSTGTLRWAVMQANSTPGADVIDFMMPVGAMNNELLIALNSSLPIINDDLTIDGSTVSRVRIVVVGGGVVFNVEGVDNLTINDLNLSPRNDMDDQLLTLALRCFNCGTVVVDNITAKNMRRAISIQVAVTDLTIINSNFEGSGFDVLTYAVAVDLVNNTNLLMENNQWGGAERGLFIGGNTTPLTIHTAKDMGLNRQVVIKNSEGFSNYSANNLQMFESNSYTIDGLRLDHGDSNNPIGNSIAVINHVTGGPVTITNCLMRNRAQSLVIDPDSNLPVADRTVDYTITNNNFRNSGFAGLNIIAAVRISGGAFAPAATINMSNNRWGGTKSVVGLEINGETDIIISNGSDPNADINIESGNNFDKYGNIGGLSTGANLRILGSTNVSVEGIDVSRTSMDGFGILSDGNTNLTIDGVRFDQGEKGLQVNGGDVVVTNSTFTGMEVGAFYGPTSIGSISDSNFDCLAPLGVAIENAVQNLSDLPAENNYWGAADGPSTDGGSGEAYAGLVDADPFSTVVVATAPSYDASCPGLQDDDNETAAPTGQTIEVRTMNGNVNSLELVPNPATERVLVQFAAVETATQVMITDIFGKTLFLKEAAPFQMSLEVDLAVLNLAAGNYIVRIQNELGTQTQIMAKH